MRPPRADIAAPPFPPGTEWVGGPEPRLERLVASGPLLVHFFELAQLNSVRALPYVRSWRRRYAEHGLAVIGVHSPRFPFSRPAGTVAESLPRLGIEWPVAVDARHACFRAYGVRGWPSLFLWSRGGALRWYHLGEGEYEATELAIRGALEEAGAGADWPPPLAPLRPGDEPGARVIAPTPELFPGGSPERPWPGGALELGYAAGGAQIAADGEGAVAVELDGSRREPARVAHPGLHELVAHERHQRHRLTLRPDPGVRIHSVQFPPAPA